MSILETILRVISLVTGAIGMLILIGVLIAVIMEYTQGGTFGSLLGWAISVLVLLPTAYLTNRMADRL